MITFSAVSKRYKEATILKSVDLTIEEKEFLVLVGPSGSGKTTLLKMINRLIEPTSGQICLKGKPLEEFDLRELRLDIGYVLQQIALFPNMTVGENIQLIPEMKKWSKKERLERTIFLLDKVGLPAKDYLDRYPKELSGGEQQRVGILRAMIANPKILLMDEPFSALDAISRKQLQELTRELHREFGMTTIFVTHDTEEALLLADRIAVLHEGNIVQLAQPSEILAQPANEFVRDLFGGNAHA